MSYYRDGERWGNRSSCEARDMCRESDQDALYHNCPPIGNDIMEDSKFAAEYLESKGIKPFNPTSNASDGYIAEPMYSGQTVYKDY